jgi:transaldolase
MTPLESLVACGTKLWLDSVDPELVIKNRKLGASGATSNPIIVSNIIEKGGFDEDITRFIRDGLSDNDIAWKLTDKLVRQAQEVFLAVWEETKGNNGYVSFELDPLLEDPARGMPDAERTRNYIELGKKWASGHKNRMIKVPATPAGLAALEEMVASGITVNVTLIFSDRQYETARAATWRGAQRRATTDQFKSVYSIFVSRLDVYTKKHVPHLSDKAQGLVGIVNAKRIWKENRDFWAAKRLALQQEMIFASTGAKLAGDAPWKYVEAFAGADIETNPPETNDAVQSSGRTFTRQVDQLPPQEVLVEISRVVDMDQLERVLMEEGIAKFAKPQHDLLALIGRRRAELLAKA